MKVRSFKGIRFNLTTSSWHQCIEEMIHVALGFKVHWTLKWKKVIGQSIQNCLSCRIAPIAESLEHLDRSLTRSRPVVTEQTSKRRESSTAELSTHRLLVAVGDPK